MKKAFSLISLVALFIVFFTSCKKEYLELSFTSNASLKKHHKEKKDKKCKAGKTECPANPMAVGMAVLSDGYQVDSWVNEVTIYYINPNPAEDTCALVFTIGGNEYLAQRQLHTTDGDNLGSFSGTIAVPTVGFNAVVVGYHLNQRCDCDSSYYSAIYYPITTNSNALFSVSRTVGAKTYFSSSNQLLEKMIGTPVLKK